VIEKKQLKGRLSADDMLAAVQIAKIKKASALLFGSSNKTVPRHPMSATDRGSVSAGFEKGNWPD
jgi:hypothetical protein